MIKRFSVKNKKSWRVFGPCLVFVLSFVTLGLYARRNNVSVPVLGKLVRQKYFNVRFKILNLVDSEGRCKKSRFKLFVLRKYQKILFYAILILKSGEEGYHVVKEDVFNNHGLLNSGKLATEDEVRFALNVIDRIKKSDEVEISALEKLDDLLLRLYKQRQKKVARLSASGVAMLVLVAVISSVATTFFAPQVNQMYAATYGWVQNDWSGGADESALATHESSQSGWTKYFSKSDNVGVEDGKLTQLTATADTWVENSEAEYSDHGTLTNVYVANGRIYPKKAVGGVCVANEECIDYCINGACTDLWVAGPCSGIIVQDIDSGTKQWKTTQTSCSSPQCEGGDLVENNSVDFSLYPARDTCKVVGGRLPTSTELSCMYSNRVSYGNNFVAGAYWSSTEYDDSKAWVKHFGNANLYGYGKTSGFNVRCVGDE